MFGGVFSSEGAKLVNNSHLGCAASVKLKPEKLKRVKRASSCVRAPRLPHIKGLLCKQVKQLEPGLHCLRLHTGAGREALVRCVAPAELLADVVRKASTSCTQMPQVIPGAVFNVSVVALQGSRQWEVVPANVFTLRISKLGGGGGGDFGESVTPVRSLLPGLSNVFYVFVWFPTRLCGNRTHRQPEKQPDFCQRGSSRGTGF